MSMNSMMEGDGTTQMTGGTVGIAIRPLQKWKSCARTRNLVK